MEKDIFLCTSTFPYGVGEQFIENELPHWGDHEVVIVPAVMPDSARDTGCIKTDIRVAENFGYYRKFVFSAVCSTLFSPTLLAEILRQRSRMVRPDRFVRTLSFLYLAYRYRNAISDTFKKEDLDQGLNFYCYWFSWQAMGLLLLKNRHPKLNVIARAHRGDVYEYASPEGLLPFRKFMGKKIDHIYPISNDAAEYLKSQFEISSHKITVSRLGVNCPANEAISVENNDNTIFILSASYAKAVKRVPLIASQLKLVAEQNKSRKIVWTHFGDGPELSLAKEIVKSSRVCGQFPGQVNNADVLKFYEQNHVDVFVNLSTSEGIPVSIMEAIIQGVPVLATSVGGVTEIVVPEVGELLAVDFDLSEFTNALEHTLNKNSDDVKSFGRKMYDAAANYKQFKSILTAHFRGTYVANHP